MRSLQEWNPSLFPHRQQYPVTSVIHGREYNGSRKKATQSVLIVESCHEVFDSLASDRELLGFQISHARTADEAYKRLSSTGVDLVIANLDLPDESGWLLAEKISITNSHSRVWLYVVDDSIVHGAWADCSSADYVFHNSAL